MKDYDGSFTSMESYAIIDIVKSAPSMLLAFIRYLCMDDDTTTCAHLKKDEGFNSKGCISRELAGVMCMDDDPTTRAYLKKDEGSNSKGCLSRELAGVMVNLDPPHHKRAIHSRFYGRREERLPSVH